MLVYPREKPLFMLALAISSLFWLALVLGTVGIALLYAPFVFLGYLFAHSAFISHVKGTGVRLSPDQLPELYERLCRGCERLSMSEIPEAYLLNGNGVMNALATRFLRRNYVVLFSDIVDALDTRPDGVDFYIGHELGHIRRGHLRWGWVVAPATVLPILGAAYSRAREYSCDLHGLACCLDPKDAAYGLAVLAAGERSWDQIDLGRYGSQSDESGRFFMSFHELTGDYPWLTKRIKHVLHAANGTPPSFPRRHPLAFLFALTVPRVGGGGGGLAALVSTVAIVGVLAAIAVPNFLKFQQRAALAPVNELRQQVESSATTYIYEHQQMPSSLSAMGLPETLSNAAVAAVSIEDQSFVIHLAPGLEQGGGEQVILSPYAEGGALHWNCEGSLEPALLSSACGTSSGSEMDVFAAALAGASDQEMTGSHAASTAVAPSQKTCAPGFRQSASYRGLGSKGQDALRDACNEWKLEQLEAQMQNDF